MATLTQAHNELFRRTPDGCFRSFEAVRRRGEPQASDDPGVDQKIVLTRDLTLCVDDRLTLGSPTGRSRNSAAWRV